MSEELLKLCECVTLVDTDGYLKIMEGLRAPIDELKTAEGKNSKFYKVFHLLCNCDSKEDTLMKFIAHTITFVKSIQIEKHSPENYTLVVQKMLNMQTRISKKTPVFEAVWFNKKVKNTQKVVRKFVEFKPDLNGKDADGQSLLHICTICGHLSLLAYFSLDLGMSLEVLDNNQRTPLHVAALEGKEPVCAFLIAYSEKFELRDKNGFTPLHLAAFTSSYRTIRHMIMKGASRKSRTPDYTALEIGKIMTISPEVLTLLKEPSCFEYLNPISPPLSQVSNSKSIFYLNLIVFFLRFTIIVLIFYEKLPEYLIAVSGTLGLFSLLFLIISSQINPGFALKGTGLAELYVNHKEEDICAYCSILKEKSMKHCQRCNKCVKKFDHHCPWIHNCVGAGNHKFFYLYVLFTNLDFLFHSIMGIIVVVLEYDDMKSLNILNNEPSWLVVTCAMFIGVFCGFLFVALTPLVYVQSVNLITGMTTHDRFARQTGGIRDSRNSAFSIPFIESEQIPASLLEAGTSNASVVREIRSSCCCLNKTVSFVRDSGYEEMQKTSSIKD